MTEHPQAPVGYRIADFDADEAYAHLPSGHDAAGIVAFTVSSALAHCGQPQVQALPTRSP